MTASALERKTSERVRISVGKNGTTTWMPQELLFELKDARVTPHIATFGGTSYQIATIGSVHVARRKRSNPFAVLTFLLGLGVLAAAIVKSRMTGLADEYFSMAVTGVAVMLAALLLQLIWPGRVYVLVLRTSSGDVDAVTSRNKEFVSNLQKAVEQAFLVRAREPPVSEAGGRLLLRAPSAGLFFARVNGQPKPCGVHRDPTAWLGWEDSNSQMSF